RGGGGVGVGATVGRRGGLAAGRDRVAPGAPEPGASASARRGAALRGARRWWRESQWLLAGLLAIVALTLGWVGFREVAAARGEALAPLSALYLALQLFTLSSGMVPDP